MIDNNAETVERSVSLMSASTESDDLGSAERLKAFFGSNLLHLAGRGFLRWDGRVWRAAPPPTLITEGALAARRYVAEIQDARDAGDTEAAKLLPRARYYTDTRAIGRSLDLLKSMLDAAPQSFDAQPHLLAVANGTVDLRTGELQPHRRSDRLTRLVPVDYDSAALPEAFCAFLKSVQPDQEVQDYLQRLLGYGVTGETSEQILSVWVGTGANGKSVLQDVVTTLMSEHTATPPFTTFTTKASDGPRNDLATLQGARLVFAPEGNRSAVLDEAVLKRVTGQDLITARFLYQEHFSYRPEFLLCMVSNSFPRIVTDDEGTWRRFHVLSWPVTVAKEDRIEDLAGRLVAAEGPGILAWLVEGARRWYEAGLQPPPAITAETTRRRDLSDSLAGFVGTVLVPAERASRVRLSDAFTAFTSWADSVALGDSERFHSMTAFREALEERGFESGKRSVICIYGARLDPDAITSHVDASGNPFHHVPGQTPLPSDETDLNRRMYRAELEPADVRAVLAEAEGGPCYIEFGPQPGTLGALLQDSIGPAMARTFWNYFGDLDEIGAAIEICAEQGVRGFRWLWLEWTGEAPEWDYIFEETAAS